jgi:hypothetical protein
MLTRARAPAVENRRRFCQDSRPMPLAFAIFLAILALVVALGIALRRSS